MISAHQPGPGDNTGRWDRPRGSLSNYLWVYWEQKLDLSGTTALFKKTERRKCP